MKAASLHNLVGYVRRLAVSEAGALSDRELLDRFVTCRDQAAFTELVRRHGPMVLAACRRVLRHEHDAEDVFQAAFLVLARRAPTIRNGETLGGWLFQVSYRLALRARNVTERRREQTLSLESELHASPLADGIGLDEELARLPDEYRSVIVLCYLEGRTQAEAARILATTTQAVNSRLKRAREVLRHRYRRLGAGVLLSACTSSVLSEQVLANVVQQAMSYSANGVCEASARTISLAKGAVPMFSTTTKLTATMLLVASLLFTALFVSPSSGDDRPALAPNGDQPQNLVALAEPIDKTKSKRGCIILWMAGGPSQIDTFDPKVGGIALFTNIDTNVKGLQFAETLPKLAKQADQLAVIRSLTHGDGDHERSAFLMHTARKPGGAIMPPRLGSVLARELGDGLKSLPRFVCIDSTDHSPGYLGEAYAPVRVGGKAPFPPPRDVGVVLPGDAAFEAIDKENGATMRKNVAKAFDLKEEKDATRDAYGRQRFGNNVLLARRLREAGVPVIEVAMTGWDTHANAIPDTLNMTRELDRAFSALLSDLKERKMLDDTLIVWMGEFGRTPRINPAKGRDHYPQAFSVVLAGAGIKGGQVIGKTSADGIKVEERPVSPQELHATIYQSLGIDPAKKYRVPNVGDVPLLEMGTKAVKEALR